MENNTPSKFPKKLFPEVGDILPISGLRADFGPVLVTGFSVGFGRVVTNIPTSQGGFVELEPERVHRLLGLPIGPLAEDVLPNPGCLRGSRLNPETRCWR